MERSDVDRIKDRLSIVDVVSPYVDLKPAGSRMKGLSPFTKEKTPSFFVSPEQGYYHCFSTDQGGDIFTFIQTIEGLDFPGALKLLAEKAGVELSGNTQQNREYSQKKQKLYEVLERATEFFEERYKEATKAQHFVAKRGIEKKIAQSYRIGYAPDNWRDLHQTLQKDFSDEILLEAGLIKNKEGSRGSSTYDVFRDRVVFPIRDIAGRVVGFSGRRLDGEKMAKYLNTPETDIFKKSHVLYGLYEGRQKIRELDFAILVEGQIDLVLSHQIGFANTVASSGTAFTSYHLELINRYSNNLILAFDSDQAGIKAMIKVAEQAYISEMQVKTVIIPDDSDPADIISQDKNRWREVIKHATSVPAHLAQTFKDKARNETNYLNSVTKVIIPLIRLIKSPVIQDSELQKVSEISGISLEVLKAELQSKPAKEFSRSTAGEQPLTPNHVEQVANDTESPESAKQKLLKDIVTKKQWIQHNYPDANLKDLPFKIPSDIEPSTADLLGKNYGDMRTATDSFNQSVKDYLIIDQVQKIDEQISALSLKKGKTPDDLNNLHILIKQREDLLTSQ